MNWNVTSTNNDFTVDYNEIRKGDKFKCTKTFLNAEKLATFIEDEVYISTEDDYIMNRKGESCYWEYVAKDPFNWPDHFQRYEEKGEEYCGCKPDKDYFQSIKEEYGRRYKGTELLISQECDAMKELLISKNRKYSDSALKPSAIFGISPVVAIKARISDKLNRLANDNKDEDEDIILDLLGYFILLRIATKKELSE